MGFFSRAWQNYRQRRLAGDVITLLSSMGSVPPRRGTPEMLIAYATQPWLHAIVRKIAWTCHASMRWELYDAPADEEGRQRITYNDPGPGGELLRMLGSPNDKLSKRAFWETYFLHRELAGEAFLIVDRGMFDQPVKLTPHPPHLVVDVPDPRTKTRHFEVSPVFGGSPVVYKEEDVIYCRDIDPFSPLSRGVSTAKTLNELLGIFASATQNINAWFYNGMVPDFLLSINGAQPQDLEVIKRDLQEKYGGPRKAHRLHATGRSFQLQRIDTTFADQQLVDLIKWDAESMQRTFGMPPEIMGIITGSSRATIESAEYFLQKHLILPRLLAIRDDLQQFLVPQFGKDLFLEVRSPVPEDKEFALRCISVAPSAFTMGEVRRLAGLLPGKNADKPLTEKPIQSGQTNVNPGKGNENAV